ncbi:MAG: hypothetical protein NC397_09310 [Clostridium sp.]|nr:hypothetical protein [Clostridium sp.]
MRVLDNIEKKLQEINPNTHFVKFFDIEKISNFNFLVFGKGPLRKNADGKNLQQTFKVIIANENYIEDELVLRIIDAIEEIPGLKLSSNTSFNYDYIQKGKTDFAVEALMLEFSKTLVRW